MSINIGDAVRLKVGGPIMTVTAVGTNDDGSLQVTCTWVDMSLKEETGVYPIDALVAADRPKPTVAGPGGIALGK